VATAGCFTIVAWLGLLVMVESAIEALLRTNIAKTDAIIIMVVAITALALVYDLAIDGDCFSTTYVVIGKGQVWPSARSMGGGC
jgi:hypothetical protein